VAWTQPGSVPDGGPGNVFEPSTAALDHRIPSPVRSTRRSLKRQPPELLQCWHTYNRVSPKLGAVQAVPGRCGMSVSPKCIFPGHLPSQ
jgi:hypothetical protein